MERRDGCRLHIAQSEGMGYHHIGWRLADLVLFGGVRGGGPLGFRAKDERLRGMKMQVAEKER